MQQGCGPISDSQPEFLGEIPGTSGNNAFYRLIPQPSPIPILIAVPHAGRAYPTSLLERMRHPGFVAQRLEDRYVDLLAEEVARETGASLLVAQAPRAMIDLNRASDDVDWDMIGDRFENPSTSPFSQDVGCYTPHKLLSGRRAKSGLGLIPRRLPGLGELWKRRHNSAELTARISGIHAPYHDCLAASLRELRRRWGAVLLIDLHSMPSLTLHGGHPAPEFVVGDRFGSSCHGTLIAHAFSYFAEMRRGTAHNRPYAGGYVLERHADAKHGFHAFQLEIDRASYLDSRLLECGDGFADMANLLIGLVRRLAGEVANLGQNQPYTGWQEAAE
ncbi:MAG: hypothetical protein RLY97_1828 [Pseudomonadota bacterium]